MQWRVWLRKRDETWWKPVDAPNAEAAVKQLRRGQRQYVTRVDPIRRPEK